MPRTLYLLSTIIPIYPNNIEEEDGGGGGVTAAIRIVSDMYWRLNIIFYTKHQIKTVPLNPHDNTMLNIILHLIGKGDQSWVFIGRTDTEAETPILWPTQEKSWLNGKDPDAGRDWGQEEKGMAEDEMAGWHHWLDGYEFE